MLGIQLLEVSKKHRHSAKHLIVVSEPKPEQLKCIFRIHLFVISIFLADGDLSVNIINVIGVTGIIAIPFEYP